MKFSTIFFLGTLLLVNGCGGKKELSEAEKQRVKRTIAAVGNIPSSVNSAGRAHDHVNDSNLNLGLLNSFLGNVAQTDSNPQQAQIQRMSQVLQEKTHSGECQIKIDMPQSLNMSTPFGSGPRPSMDHNAKLSMAVSGDQCPVAMSLLLEIKAKGADSSGSFDGSFAFTYEVKDDSFRELNDVDFVDIKGEFGMTAKVSSESKSSMDGSMDIKGMVRSQQEGEVKFYLSGKMDGNLDRDAQKGSASAEIKFGLEYDDFTGEFKVVAKQDMSAKNSSNSVKYYLNDKEITEGEFEEYVQASSLNNMTQQQDQPSPHAGL